MGFLVNVSARPRYRDEAATAAGQEACVDAFPYRSAGIVLPKRQRPAVGVAQQAAGHVDHVLDHAPQTAPPDVLADGRARRGCGPDPLTQPSRGVQQRPNKLPAAERGADCNSCDAGRRRHGGGYKLDFRTVWFLGGWKHADRHGAHRPKMHSPRVWICEQSSSRHHGPKLRRFRQAANPANPTAATQGIHNGRS